MLHGALPGQNPDDYIFSNNRNPILPARLYKVWKKACQDARVKHISLQQASRHSTATQIKEKHEKATQQEIMEQLGHDNIRSQKQYIVDKGWLPAWHLRVFK